MTLTDMRAFRPLVEWYFGIEPAGSGEASHWSLTWGGSALPAGWRIGVIAAAAVLVVVLYLRETQGLGRRRWALLGLRLAAVAIVCAWIGELSLQVVRTGLPTLVLMIDTSASMGLEDQAASLTDAGRGSEAASGARPSRGSRLDLARAALLADDGKLLNELERRYRLQLYEFSGAARAIPQADDAGSASWASQLAQLQPHGPETRPASGVDQALSDFRGAPPAALVVLTDGISSVGPAERLSSAQQPAALGVPVFTVAVGSSEPARDIELYDLQVDSVVFVDDTVAAEFLLRGYGLKGHKVPIVLRSGERGTPLGRTTAVIAEDGQALPVRIPFTPKEEGEYDLVIEAQPVDGELNRENNVLRRRVQARREQIRVLLVERAPRWEYRHLKSVLERDRNVELRTVLQQADLEHQHEDRTALPGFPATREALFEYDVVILGDVDLQYLNPGALEALRDFVAERGGGLICIAGEQHNPTAFQGTVIEPLLPIDTSQVSRPEKADTPFHLVPARLGADHPLLRLSDRETSTEFWQSLPALYWAIEALVRRPGALVLATHDTRETANGRLPLIVLQRFGRGQVLFHATDELWRWRQRVGDRYYGRYWLQAIRQLCRAQLLNQAGSAELTSDRLIYQQGEDVRFRLRFLDESLLPADEQRVMLIVERSAGRRYEVPLQRSPHQSAEFEGVLSKVAAGTYHAWLAAPALPQSPPSCDFTAVVPQRELQLRATDTTDLARAASLTGGVALDLGSLSTLPERLPTGEPMPLRTGESIRLWARWELLLLFVVVLAAEWVLRKRARLV